MTPFRDRIAEIADDFIPSTPAEAAQALEEMRLALQAALADCEGDDVDDYAGYTPDIQQILREQANGKAAQRARWAEFDKRVDGVNYAKDGSIMDGTPSGEFFHLTYASWLILPRLSLQEMPIPWQAEFYRMLEEAEAAYGLQCPEDTIITRKVNGKFASLTHWNNYRSGTVAEALAIDKEQG